MRDSLQHGRSNSPRTSSRCTSNPPSPRKLDMRATSSPTTFLSSRPAPVSGAYLARNHKMRRLSSKNQRLLNLRLARS